MCSGRHVALALCPVGFFLGGFLDEIVVLHYDKRFAGVQLSQVVKISFSANIIKYCVIVVFAVVLVITHAVEVVADAVGGDGNNSRRVVVVVGAAVAHDDRGGAGVGVRGFNGFPCLFNGKGCRDAFDGKRRFKVKSDLNVQSLKDCRVNGDNRGGGFIVFHGVFSFHSLALCAAL